MGNYNVANFFRGFLDRGADNRMLIGYDSMTSDASTLQQGTSVAGIMDTWDIPTLSNGESPWVGYGSCGIHNSYSRLFYSSGLVNFNSPQGWTRAPSSALRLPGGTAATSLCGGPPSGGESAAISPQPYADYSIATGAARTAYLDTELFAAFSSANFSTSGIVAMALALLNGTGAVTATYPRGIRNTGCPFSGKQTSMRLIWTGNTAGPTDMRVRPVRQYHGDMTINANNTALVGAIGAAVVPNFSTAGVNSADIDCGSGAGIPGFWLVNPNTPAGASPLRMYITGCRAFRSSAGVPIAGTSIATLATGASYDSMHASCLGILDADMDGGALVSDQSTASDRTPNPYFSAANAQSYLSKLCGRTTGSGYPNKIIIYGGHNRDSTEASQLASGVSAKMKDVLLKIMAKHTANAAALGSDAPDFLIVHAEKYGHSGNNETLVRNTAATHLAAAQAYGAKASCIDLLDYTDDGTGDFTLDMPWSVARSWASAAGSGSGPVAATSPNVHNSYAGNVYIWRLVWEIGMESLGYSPGTLDARGFRRTNGGPRGRRA